MGNFHYYFCTNKEKLVVRQQAITNKDLINGVSAEEVKRQVHNHIDKLFDK